MKPSPILNRTEPKIIGQRVKNNWNVPKINKKVNKKAKQPTKATTTTKKKLNIYKKRNIYYHSKKYRHISICFD